MSVDSLSVEDVLQSACRQVSRRDAETLLLHLLKKPRAWLRAHPEAAVDPAVHSRFMNWVGRRERHEPLQHLTGVQEFFDLPLEVTPEVLIPRPETELLVEAVLTFANTSSLQKEGAPLSIVDVGTGSGAIALALAAHLPHAAVTALDASVAALGVAQRNAERLALRHIRFLSSDLLSAVKDEPAPWDVVVSNPPYIPLVEQGDLQPEVRDFEPHLALFAGHDGLAVYRRLIPEAWKALRRGGLIALEIGYGQQPAIDELLRGWEKVHFENDYAGIPRVAKAFRP